MSFYGVSIVRSRFLLYEVEVCVFRGETIDDAIEGKTTSISPSPPIPLQVPLPLYRREGIFEAVV